MIFEFSAGAIIYRSSGNGLLFLLLLKENNEYDIPKGHIEKGESAEEAAIREIKEESGLDVRLMPYFSRSTRYFFYKGKEKIAKSLRVFIAKAETEKMRISYEHKGYEWCSYESILIMLKKKSIRKPLSTQSTLSLVLPS